MTRIFSCLLLLLVFFSSCTKDGDTIYVVQEEEADNRPVLYFIYAEKAIGDMGYVDEILNALTACAQKDSMLLSLTAVEKTIVSQADVNTFISNIHNIGNGRRSLVVILNDNYEPLLRSYSDVMKDVPNTDFLLVESTDSLSFFHTLQTPTTGAMYLAGQVVGRCMSDVNNVLVVKADSVTESLSKSQHAFSEGLSDSHPSVNIQTVCLDDAGRFNALDSMYRYSYVIDGQYDLVLPLCGGSAKGFYRYNSEHPNSFYTVGIDKIIRVPEYYNGRAPFSVVKNIGKVVEDWIDKWAQGKPMPMHTSCGMQSGGTYLELSEDNDYLNTTINSLMQTAIEKENEYENR